jgi:hypothetical protein
LPAPRALVPGFAKGWQQEATGGIVLDDPDWRHPDRRPPRDRMGKADVA